MTKTASMLLALALLVFAGSKVEYLLADSGSSASSPLLLWAVAAWESALTIGILLPRYRADVAVFTGAAFLGAGVVRYLLPDVASCACLGHRPVGHMALLAIHAVVVVLAGLASTPSKQHAVT